MTAKQCTKCGVAQPFANFSRNKTTKDGLQTHCRACVSAYNKEYREKHRTKPRRKKLTEQEKKVADRKRNKAYKQCNAERVSKYGKQWREANVEYMRNYQKQWRENNRDKRRAAHAKRKALKKGSKGEVGADIIYQMAEDQQWLCAYCESPLFGEFHVDHMVPLSKGGIHDWTNLAITCPKCNMRKRVSTVEEFIVKLKKSSKKKKKS